MCKRNDVLGGYFEPALKFLKIRDYFSVSDKGT